MDKHLLEQFKDKKVRISIGTKNFIPPPGFIELISNDYIVFHTDEKSSLIAIVEIRTITPV